MRVVRPVTVGDRSYKADQVSLFSNIAHCFNLKFHTWSTTERIQSSWLGKIQNSSGAMHTQGKYDYSPQPGRQCKAFAAATGLQGPWMEKYVDKLGVLTKLNDRD